MSAAQQSLADILFVAVLVLAGAGTYLWLRREGGLVYRQHEEAVRTRGYTVSHARQAHRGPVTWVWGRYPRPVPCHLHVSARDPVASAAGRLGIADLRVGHEAFDRRFFVRSNRPDRALAFLTPARCESLLQAGDVEFITASIGSLLTPDYWPAEAPRDRRDLWMLRVDGHVEGAALEPLVALARTLAGDLHDASLRLPHTPEDCRAGPFEGR